MRRICAVKTAALGVRKTVFQQVGQPLRRFQPVHVRRTFIQVDESVCCEGVVVQIPRVANAAAPPGAIQGVPGKHDAFNKRRRFACGLLECRDLPGESGPGEGGNHKGVPGGNDFIVAGRTDTQIARALKRRSQSGIPAFPPVFAIVFQDVSVQNIPFVVTGLMGIKIAFLRYGVYTAEFISIPRSEMRQNLLPGPEIKPPFFSFAVRVFRRIEPAFGIPQVPQHIIQRLTGHHLEERIPGNLPGFQVSDRQLCIVIQHFLEMGHPPFLIGGITMETAPDMVVQAARRHVSQCGQCHIQQ
ncbi:MAG: hypothetical protein BWY09_02396 [Candidatus Hydrogenedentes bacterium ADurb.Bin179]|nr:MAG: hypothetical protein BWY09_02396 [Candidatus Hydrogenedentes bacterium ADurb.Bin179]